jgi:opacity protein-like surface antigen
LQNQFVVKYDVYVPNNDISASDIGAPGSNLTASDIKYTTLGLGWIYYWDSNVMFTLYYDWVKNEKINAKTNGPLAPFTQDLKDNVLTIRMQYKF